MSMFKKTVEWLYLRTKNNLVYSDPLTSVYNRQYYQRVLIKKSTKDSAIVVLLDLNNLKAINDTLGHAEGDKLLIDIASSLKNFGTVCRMGGDEFLLLTDKNRLEQFKKYARKKQEFCYAYDVKPKGVKLEDVLDSVDKDLVKIKNDYRKANARGACFNKGENQNKEE